MAKLLVKRGKEAFREARRAREAGETPRGWEARLAERARRAYEDARATEETVEEESETPAGFESRSGRGEEEEDSWSRGDGWDAGDGGDARAREETEEKEEEGDDDARAESDGAGIGLRVLYRDTFDEATRAARETTDDAAEEGDAAGETRTRWLVVACTRQSPTCRYLAPILGILSHDSAFTSVGGGGYAVGWVDCTPADVRPWCLERLGATAVPRLVAFANGREKPYEGGFKGDCTHEIRRFAQSFATESTTCDESTRATGDG